MPTSSYCSSVTRQDVVLGHRASQVMQLFLLAPMTSIEYHGVFSATAHLAYSHAVVLALCRRCRTMALFETITHKAVFAQRNVPHIVLCTHHFV